MVHCGEEKKFNILLFVLFMFKFIYIFKFNKKKVFFEYNCISILTILKNTTIINHL